MELRKPVLGWDEKFYFCLDTPGYMVSNYGRILSIGRTIIRSSGRKQTFQEKILATQINPKGYPTVTIRNNGKKRCFEIHRLVAKTFIVNENNKPITNHKDGNKKNNYYKNLEWATYSENIIHAYKNNLR